MSRPLTGKELKFAAKHSIPVHYTETYFNRDDRHMNFQGECVMTPAKVGYYIGESDINPDDFTDTQLATGEFPEGTFSVKTAHGQKYE